MTELADFEQGDVTTFTFTTALDARSHS